MEKQRSFSVKPIRSLVFFFTISFSVIFLMFFSNWVFKSIPSISSISVQSVGEFNGSSADFLLRNSVLFGRRLGNSSLAQERESGATKAQGRESGGTGNSSLTPFGKNVSLTVNDVLESSKGNDEEAYDFKKDDIRTPDVSVGDFSVSFGAKSTVNDVLESSKGNDEEVHDFKKDDVRTPDVSVGDFSVSFGAKSTVNDVLASSKGNDEEVHKVVSDFKKNDASVSIRNRIEQESKIACDVTIGRWVFDERYPLYTNATCPFIDEGFNCGGNGRLDNEYMKWRWQPRDCDVPRFNATKMLELIRGKRLVFVGDSLNRNQWESMLCLLMGGVRDPKTVYEARGRRITKERNNYSFKFEEYKCTVEFYVSHFLVHESKARVGKKKRQTLRIDAIDKGSSRWRGADILVFNTAHWWNHHKTKAGINYYQEGDLVHPRLDVTEAFRRALLTWALWVDKNINPHKTRVFFRSSAPSHFSGGLWNTGGHCKEAFRPINETFVSVYPQRNLIAEEILKQMRNPVTFLNITRLSDYRPDAHPSMYGRKSVNPGVQDCSHWCLPGVPDNWNELLYYYLKSRTRSNFIG